jgi:Aldehyde dehydrogenase family
MSYPALKLYIGGKWKTASGQPVINPADESVLGTVPHAMRSDLDDALDVAEGGFKIWSRTAPAKRAEILIKAAAIIHGRGQIVASQRILGIPHQDNLPRAAVEHIGVRHRRNRCPSGRGVDLHVRVHRSEQGTVGIGKHNPHAGGPGPRQSRLRRFPDVRRYPCCVRSRSRRASSGRRRWGCRYLP